MGWFDSHSRVKRLLRKGSYDTLVKMHQQGIDVLQDLSGLVHDNDSNVRSHIAHALLWLVQHDANLIDSFIRIILQLLDDGEPFVRARACDAFGIVVTVGEYYDEEKQVIPRLIALLDDELLVRESSAPIIGKMAKKHPKEMADAIPKLIQLLEDGDALTIAFIGIGAMEKTFESFPKIVKPHIGTLIRLLNDNGEDIIGYSDDLPGRVLAQTERRRRRLGAPSWQGSAAFILGEIGAVEALVPLSQLLDDDRTFLFDDNKVISVAEVAREAYKKIEKIKIEQENIDRAKAEIVTMIDEALEEKTEK